MTPDRRRPTARAAPWRQVFYGWWMVAGLAVTAFGGHSATLVGAAALTAIGAFALHRAHRAFTTEAAAG